MKLIQCGVLTLTVLSMGILRAQNFQDSINKVKSELKEVKKLKVSGWVQTQYQWTQRSGAKTFDGGDFPMNSNNRFMIRRGRIKFTYTNNLFQSVLQLNATERGVNLVEIFGRITDPWTKSFTFSSGVMNRPFGFEIQQSSSDRETPERARFTQVLLPNERDLGAMISYQPVKSSKLYGLKIDAGFFNGTGIAVPGTSNFSAGLTDFDAYKDFIGRAFYKKSIKEDKVTFGLGASYYNGGFVFQNNRVFKSFEMDSNQSVLAWKMEDTTSITFKGGKAPRLYYDIEAQFSVKTKLGTTTLRGEYITGTQSGMVDESKSPATLPSKMDTYVRQFNGGYAYFIQRLGKTKHEIAVKYEFYEPNTVIDANAISMAANFSKAELKYTMLGLGYNVYINDNVKLMLYYNHVVNETTPQYNEDFLDDVFTARVQYRF